MRTLLIAAVTGVIIASPARAECEFPPPTEAEKAAELVVGYAGEDGWTYVRVRHPKSDALFAIRVRIKEGDACSTEGGTRLLEAGPAQVTSK